MREGGHLGRPRNGREYNIKMDLQEVGCAGVWIDLAQDRERLWVLAFAGINFRFP
jgi:hypothetical protein